MTPLAVGLLGIALLFVLLLSRMAIAFAMVIVGFLGFAYLNGFDRALGLLRIVPYASFASYDLSVIPLFILMGSFCYYAGISSDLYHTIHKFLGQLRGGLAMATVGACAAFAAVSGSSVATAATMGTVALPEMKRYKYDSALATGALAAGGTIGILIPPSVVLVVYAITTEQSIGQLFMAGFFPGILEAAFYIITIAILCKLNPQIGPPAPKTDFNEKLASLKETWVVLALFVLVIGGIYLGIFTPTEAAGVGAFGAFGFGVIRRKLNWEGFRSSIIESGKTAAMIFICIMGAMVLNYFLAVTKMTATLGDMITAYSVNRYIILLLVLFFYIVLGCFIGPMEMILLTMPIFFPLMTGLGFDPIWFGIIVTRVGEMGMITPPVGMNVYVIHGVAKDVPMGTIFRGVLPFVIADIFHIGLLILFPQIALFLPSVMI